MNIIIVRPPCFEPEIRVGILLPQYKIAIQDILNTMSYDEYAGYSPDEQKKYQKIKSILSLYPKPNIDILTKKR